MAQAKNNDTVKVHYTGTLSSGNVFDSSVGNEPLQFTIGGKQVLEDFEGAVVGMSIGDKKTFTIPAAKAYGEKLDSMMASVPRAQFPADIAPEVGQRFQVGQPDGGQVIVTVAEVTDDTVIIDANHPLAGQDLTFAIELVEIH